MLFLGSRMKALLLNASLPEFLGADHRHRFFGGYFTRLSVCVMGLRFPSWEFRQALPVESKRSCATGSPK